MTCFCGEMSGNKMKLVSWVWLCTDSHHRSSTLLMAGWQWTRAVEGARQRIQTFDEAGDFLSKHGEEKIVKGLRSGEEGCVKTKGKVAVKVRVKVRVNAHVKVNL